MGRWIYWTTAASITFGTVVRLEALWGGYRSDDFVHRAIAHGKFPGARAVWDMFRFAGPYARDNRALVDFGYLPWWSSEKLSLAMLRPLPSLLSTLDHQVFGDNPWLHHLHSLCWWVLLCLVVALLFFCWLESRVAALALLLFCVDEAFSIPFAWLANRSTLVALTFGGLALYAQQRHAQDGDKRFLLAAFVCLSAAMTAGEYAFGMLGYMLVILFTAPRERARLQGALLCVPPAVYLAVRSALHFGTRGSHFYLAPFSDPLTFLAIGSGRIGILGSDLWLGLSATWSGGSHPLHPLTLRIAQWNLDFYRQLPSFGVIQALVGGLTLCILLWTVVRVYRRSRESVPLVLGVGSVLALLPSAGSLPEDRLIGAAVIGQSALTAIFLAYAVQTLLARQLHKSVALLALCGAAVHLGCATVHSVSRAQSISQSSHEQLAMVRSAELPARSSEQTRAYVISAPNFMLAANLPFARQVLGLPPLRSYRRLHGAIAPLELRRISDRSLELRILVANVQGSLTGTLYRTSSEPLHTGDRFSLPGLDVEIVEARQGDAYRTRYTFDHSLDSPRLWLTHATAGRLRHLQPPAVGKAMMLPAAHY